MDIYELRSRRFSIFIEGSPQQSMATHRQVADGDSEAGGVLIGETRPECLVVTHATTPQPGDTRGRLFFNRKAEGHQEQVIERWKESQGRLDYIGEWHTHPEKRPQPSLVDRVGWIWRSVQSKKPLLVLIVGQENCFVAIQDGLKLEQAHLCG